MTLHATPYYSGHAQFCTQGAGYTTSRLRRRKYLPYLLSLRLLLHPTLGLLAIWRTKRPKLRILHEQTSPLTSMKVGPRRHRIAYIVGNRCHCIVSFMKDPARSLSQMQYDNSPCKPCSSLRIRSTNLLLICTSLKLGG